jgi:tetratricopeptide (TPR) repeat protein
MRKIFQSSLTVSVFVLLFCGLTNAQKVDELIAEGDKLVEQFNNQKALESYLKAEKLEPNNWEILWRISRAYVDIGEHLPSSTDDQKDAQLKMFEKAFTYADKSVKLAPDQSITYLRRGIANGKIALFQGVFSAIGTVNDVKDDVEKAIQLGNGGNYIQAVAHYVLGRTHAKVCEKAYLVRLPIGLGWGDMETAIREFNIAIKLKPNFRMFYLDLAKAYIEEDEYDKAREYLYKIEKAPKQDEDDDKVLAESKKLLQEIKDK